MQKNPEWTRTISNHYWHLRYARNFDLARVRKQYRAIAREKTRLAAIGIDPEIIRLFCRHMVNPRNRNAEQRYLEQLAKAS